MQKPAKIILGIDPGTLLMGYGIIEINGSQVKMKEMEVLKLSNKKDNHERLQLIHQKVEELIKKFKPHEFAIEAPFFGKNVQSMLKLGRAQGVAMAAALYREVPITEYAPKKVKQSVTGNGNASKEQVAKMLMQIFNIKEMPKLLDASDALAVAVCHHYQNGALKAKSSSWESFLKDNPTRIQASERLKRSDD